MFADPQSVTISGTAHSLPRVSSGVNEGAFRTSDNAMEYGVRSTYGRRNRRSLRFVHSKIVPDPLFPSQNVPYSMTFVVTVDAPKTGYSVAEQKAVIDGVLANLQATSGANISKLIGGEN